MRLHFVTTFVVLMIAIVSLVQSEVFSAIKELEILAENEEKLIKKIIDYKNDLGITSFYIDRKITLWQNEHKIMKNDVMKYITNPLNAFLLIKRATADIEVIANFLQVELDELKSYLGDLVLDQDDLIGAVEGLLRLQVTYRLNSNDFSNGVIDGVKTRKPLIAHDLYVIGKIASELKDHEHFVFEYFEMTLDRIKKNEDDLSEVNMNELAFLIANAYERCGDFKSALVAMKAVLSRDKMNEKAQALHDYYRRILQQVGAQNPKFKDPFIGYYEKNGKFSREKEEILFSKACRGELVKSSEEISKLHCRFVSNSFFTKIAPFKVEEFNLNPYLVIFYDIISDAEIEILKEEAKPKLTRGRFYSDKNSKAVLNSRVVKTVFLGENKCEIAAKISRRVEDMTGLTVTTAENLQVQNYGIGGHYILHYDNRLKGEIPFDLGTGNRIATVLIYLSDVVKGGYTVFPYVNLRVAPKKGAAVFWFSLKESGESEFLMKHGSCPVLLGNKWVANKWLHEYGQEFKRPCIAEEFKEFKGNEIDRLFY